MQNNSSCKTILHAKQRESKIFLFRCISTSSSFCIQRQLRPFSRLQDDLSSWSKKQLNCYFRLNSAQDYSRYRRTRALGAIQQATSTKRGGQYSVNGRVQCERHHLICMALTFACYSVRLRCRVSI